MMFNEQDFECLKKAKDLIDKDLSRHHTIVEIARHAGISETKLKSGFKHLYKVGLFGYLEKARLEKGKYMIENLNKTLKEISKSLGYKHKKNFSTAFKKKFGKPPISWKKTFEEHSRG